MVNCVSFYAICCALYKCCIGSEFVKAKPCFLFCFSFLRNFMLTFRGFIVFLVYVDNEKLVDGFIKQLILVEFRTIRHSCDHLPSLHYLAYFSM